jgi:putative peptidoglycan lipid II flippase
MTAVLLPPFTRHCARLTPRRRQGAAASPALVLSPLALLPIALFTLTRQSQVFVERYLASSLAPGTISHLNYAEKVAQMAMTLGVLVCTVTFPVIARALADGDLEAARDRVQKDLSLIGALVLAGTAVLMACAPQIVALLFQRGAFTAQDTAATASVMRVYSLGLLGQAMVGALVRPFFSTRPVVAFGTAPARSGSRSDWFPLAAMALGLLVTTTIGLAAVARHGAIGLAAANATGITLTAVLLLVGIRTRGVALRLRTVLLDQARLLAAAALAAAAAFAAARPFAAHALPSVLLGAVAGVAAFVVAAAALRAPVVTVPLAALTARLRTRGRKDEGEGHHGG